MKISVARAMKEKNRIIRKIAELEVTFLGNVVDERNSDELVDVSGNVDEWMNLKDKLVNLKVAIGKANAESGALQCVYGMEEARGTLTRLDRIPFNTKSEWSRNPVTGEMEEIKKVASLSKEKIEQSKKEVQKLIDDLQDALDEINAKTFIEFEI